MSFDWLRKMVCTKHRPEGNLLGGVFVQGEMTLPGEPFSSEPHFDLRKSSQIFILYVVKMELFRRVVPEISQ